MIKKHVESVYKKRVVFEANGKRIKQNYIKRAAKRGPNATSPAMTVVCPPFKIGP